MSIVRRAVMGATCLVLPMVAWAQEGQAENKPKPVSISYGSFEILSSESMELPDGKSTLSLLNLKTQNPRMGIQVLMSIGLDEAKKRIKTGRLTNCTQVDEAAKKRVVEGDRAELAMTVAQAAMPIAMAERTGQEVNPRVRLEYWVLRAAFERVEAVPYSPWYTCNMLK